MAHALGVGYIYSFYFESTLLFAFYFESNLLVTLFLDNYELVF